MPTLESIIADDCATYRKRIAELEAENASLKADLQRERGVLTDEERQAFLDKICSTGLD